jgi:hypothetical protein
MIFVGTIKLTGDEVQIKKDADDRIPLADIIEFTIFFKGHLGQFPDDSIIPRAKFTSMKKGNGNIITVKTNSRVFQLEFLSRHSPDIGYLRKYIAFFKR